MLCQYLEPDGPNENQTVNRLFGILNDPEVIRALEDFERPRGRRTARRQPAALCLGVRSSLGPRLPDNLRREDGARKPFPRPERPRSPYGEGSRRGSAERLSMVGGQLPGINRNSANSMNLTSCSAASVGGTKRFF